VAKVLQRCDSIYPINDIISDWSGEFRMAYKGQYVSVGVTIGTAQFIDNTDPYSDLQSEQTLGKHVPWRVGAVVGDKGFEANGKFSFGASIGTSDQQPYLVTIPIVDYNHPYGNYETTTDFQIPYQRHFGTIVETYTETYEMYNYTNAINTNVSMFYDFADFFKAGIIFELENGSTLNKTSSSYDPEIYPPSESEYTENDFRAMGWAPVVQGTAPVAEGVSLTWTAAYSSVGNMTQNNYRQDYARYYQDPNAAVKDSTENISANNFVVGLGCHTTDGLFAIGVQFDQQRLHSLIQYVNNGGVPQPDSNDEFRHQAARVGVEFKPMDLLALRAGYAAMLNVDTAGQAGVEGNCKINRYSLGLGLKITDSTQCDLVGMYDAVTPTEGIQATGENSDTLVQVGIKQVF